MATIDVLIIVFYFATIVAVGFRYAHRRQDTAESYFLAGRGLGWFAIGMSLFATNISSEHFVGLAGYGAARGLAVGNFEWLAIFALMLMGWIFAPIFLKADIYTVPELFGKRFNKTIQLYLSGLSVFTYILTKIAVSLFAGGMLLHNLLGWDYYTSAILMLMITGMYTIVGGMKAVVDTSIIQALFLIAGAATLTGIGLYEVGGISGLQTRLPEDYFTVFKPFSDPDFPWTGIIFGAPILAIWYWCTDQYIVQRILCAKNVRAAQSGVILTGFLKLLPVFILVLPGLIAAVLFPDAVGDNAYAIFLNSSLVPAGAKGLVLSGVLAALMSSLSACFISASTLLTMDFYRHFSPLASQYKQMLFGRLAGIAMAVIGIVCISLMKLVDNHIYIYLQSIQAYISPPIAAVFLLGIFWKRANTRGAIWALLVGGGIGALRIGYEWLQPEWPAGAGMFTWLMTVNFMHFAIFLFLLSAAIVVLAGILGEAPFVNIKDLTFSGNITTQWATSLKTNRLNWMFSATLLVVLFGLWRIFA